MAGDRAIREVGADRARAALPDRAEQKTCATSVPGAVGRISVYANDASVGPNAYDALAITESVRAPSGAPPGVDDVAAHIALYAPLSITGPRAKLATAPALLAIGRACRVAERVEHRNVGRRRSPSCS